MSKAGRPKAETKKEKIVSVRMKPEDYAKVKRYAESSNKTVTQVMQEGVAKLLEGQAEER
ncbi:MAG: CopG family transcriptional regulator [Lachnospiraceae bacterium]|nr:CopG family transcriptional regulator [Lachnospiraceae bacterium]